MEKYFLYLFLLFCLIECRSQNTNLKFENFEFESIFGGQKGDKSNVYCLLGKGFFRTPSSENTDELINSWILNHKKIKIILVSSLIDDNNGNINYCWLEDEYGNTINEFLIKNGCFPGGTMMRPKTLKEEPNDYMSIDESKIKVYIDSKKYEEFIQKIKKAEQFASDNKLGIWNED
ncbi:hypothetical protein ACFSX9_00015 [Flavobacterium ardleyense]|uniref:TNase-like domain-containing protein n=1 Tax=Flavobacterium ardleyense TaxID=2038737 RepID=A0ABW5Z395_9FLAO